MADDTVFAELKGSLGRGRSPGPRPPDFSTPSTFHHGDRLKSGRKAAPSNLAAAIDARLPPEQPAGGGDDAGARRSLPGRAGVGPRRNGSRLRRPRPEARSGRGAQGAAAR